MEPSSITLSPKSNFAIVDFPEPEEYTRATVSPF